MKVYGDKLDLADELREEFHEAAKVTVKEGATLLLREVQRLLRLRRGTRLTVAPEGAPPEYDEGELEASFKVIAPRVRENVVSSGIHSKHPGAARLEWGATDSLGIRTLPHPYLVPAAETVAPEIERLFLEHSG
jgi:hypothetical protein